MQGILTRDGIARYREYLLEQERSKATIDKYIGDIFRFYQFLPVDKTITKQRVMEYKKELIQTYKASSVNSILAAVNGLLDFIGIGDCRVKQLKVQKQLFCSSEKELSKAEYLRLLKAAKRQEDERLYMIMQTICATGIRISELNGITAAAVIRGKAEVACKNKTRVVFLPSKLRHMLNNYIRQKGIDTGPVFVTRSGRPVNRSNVWKAMKGLYREARVNPEKVYPHNLRHLFARTYYRVNKDIITLADLLGHSNVETTRLYTISTGKEHARRIEVLGLVST